MTAVEIAPKIQKMVVVEAPFIEELSGMAIVKILDMKEQATNMIKLKFIRNKAVLKITNKTHETVTFGQTEMIGVVDLGSLGFYKIKQEVLQEHLGRHYHFKLANDVCNQYNRFMNLMRKEEENSEGKFPWLEDTDERKDMIDRENLDKYLVEVWYSLEQYIGLKEDKLSSTTVDFIRSEGNLETKRLYWFSKPKMC